MSNIGVCSYLYYKNLNSKNGVNLKVFTPNLTVGQGSIEDTPKEVGHNMLELGKTAVLSVAEFAVLLKAEDSQQDSCYADSDTPCLNRGHQAEQPDKYHRDTHRGFLHPNRLISEHF